VFGGQDVGRRGVDNLVVVPVPSNLHLLAFDAGWLEVAEVCRLAREAASAELAKSLVDKPAEMNGLCAMIHGALAPQAPSGRMRVNIVRQVSPCYLRVQHHYNMDQDSDDNVLLPIARCVSGEAWRDKEMVCRTGRANMKFTRVPNLNDKYLEEMLWKDLQSIISVPVFDHPHAWDASPGERPTPIGVLNVDSDQPLEKLFASTDVIVLLTRVSIIVGQALRREMLP